MLSIRRGSSLHHLPGTHPGDTGGMKSPGPHDRGEFGCSKAAYQPQLPWDGDGVTPCVCAAPRTYLSFERIRAEPRHTPALPFPMTTPSTAPAAGLGSGGPGRCGDPRSYGKGVFTSVFCTSVLPPGELPARVTAA